MPDRTRGVLLIGMPGAGKSTIGVLLAKELGFDFVDTDILIQVRDGRTLQEILDAEGHLALRRAEEDVLLALDPAGLVIATGGSAVYSEAGMRRLKSVCPAVWLRVPLPIIRQRLHNFATRGIARAPGQSLEQLFDERCALYRRYADITVDADRDTPADVLAGVLRELRALGV